MKNQADTARRRFVQRLGALTAGAVAATSNTGLALGNNNIQWVMPDESDPHARTWMAFGASQKIWGKQLLPVVQRNLATIALTIAKFEPVSMLVRQTDMPLAKKLMGDKVDLVVCPHDDLWMRDTGPVFVLNKNGEKAGVDFNFNGWGG